MTTRLRTLLTITTALCLFSTPLKAQTEGLASYYANHFHGRPTSSGITYDKNAYTCAHRTYPFGTMLTATNLRTNKTTVVKVTARGPYAHKRIIDLSYAAAKDIGLIGTGVVMVRIEKVNSKNANEIELERLKIPKPFHEEELIIDLKLAHDIDSLWFLPIIPEKDDE